MRLQNKITKSFMFLYETHNSIRNQGGSHPNVD